MNERLENGNICMELDSHALKDIIDEFCKDNEQL